MSDSDHQKPWNQPATTAPARSPSRRPSKARTQPGCALGADPVAQGPRRTCAGLNDADPALQLIHDEVLEVDLVGRGVAAAVRPEEPVHGLSRLVDNVGNVEQATDERLPIGVEHAAAANGVAQAVQRGEPLG